MKYPVYQKQKPASCHIEIQTFGQKVFQSGKREGYAATVFDRRSDDFGN